MKKPPRARPALVFEPENTHDRWTADNLRAHGLVFEQCLFRDCEWSGADLRDLRFIDCRMERCNLSLAKVAGTGFQNVAFAECKLTGVAFFDSREMLFEVGFDRCRLGFASFAGRKMPRTRFSQCDLTETDLSGADLTEAVFEECGLERAVFDQTLLNGADLRTATGFVIDPTRNPLRKAKVSQQGLQGLVVVFGVEVE